MCDLHKCAGNDANIAMRSSGGVPSLLRENDTKCGGPTPVATALRDLSGSCESIDIRLGNMAHSGICLELLGGHIEKLERK